MKSEAKIEAILFKKNEPTRLKELCGILGISEDEARNALGALRASLDGRGVALLENGDEYSLVTASEAAPLIDKMVKDEMSKDLGKAGLETLSIVLYKGPVTRREIDYIRGVNSTFILRSLMVRGLVEKAVNPADARQPLYKGTSELLSFLGIGTIEDLPEYNDVRQEIESQVQAKAGSEQAE